MPARYAESVPILGAISANSESDRLGETDPVIEWQQATVDWQTALTAYEKAEAAYAEARGAGTSGTDLSEKERSRDEALRRLASVKDRLDGMIARGSAARGDRSRDQLVVGIIDDASVGDSVPAGDRPEPRLS